MEITLISKFTGEIAIILIALFKILYIISIYYRCYDLPKKKRNILVYLSVIFPIITGFVCLIKYRDASGKVNRKKSLIAFFISLVFLVSGISVNVYSQTHRWIDSQGESHQNFSDSVYQDKEGNKYTYRFDKKGYDYLYKNGTDESLDADWCYIDEDGYMHYDDDMSITAKDEHSCVDTDGKIYYPAKFTTFDKNGKVKYNFNSGNFSYDRLGNAYTYDYVPFYDKEGNKYYYSFNSDTQKGTYTNISTGEAYENEHSFVDEDGYFVYDDAHIFEQVKDKDGNKIFTDDKGNTYYWASSVTWDKEGNLRSSSL